MIVGQRSMRPGQQGGAGNGSGGGRGDSGAGSPDRAGAGAGGAHTAATDAGGAGLTYAQAGNMIQPGPMDPNYHQWYASAATQDDYSMICIPSAARARVLTYFVWLGRMAEHQSMSHFLTYGGAPPDRKYPGGMPQGMPHGAGPYPGCVHAPVIWPG